jgi:hypothetical protein
MLDGNGHCTIAYDWLHMQINWEQMNVCCVGWNIAWSPAATLMFPNEYFLGDPTIFQLTASFMFFVEGFSSTHGKPRKNYRTCEDNPQ